MPHPENLRAVTTSHTTLFGSSSRSMAPGGKCAARTVPHRSTAVEQTVARVTVSNRSNRRSDRLAPDRRLDLSIYACVGDDLSIMLGNGDENQNAGAAFGEMKSLRQELAHSLDMRTSMHRPARDDAETDRRDRKDGPDYDKRERAAAGRSPRPARPVK